MSMAIAGAIALVLFGLLLWALENNDPNPLEDWIGAYERKYPMALTYSIISEQWDRIYLWNGARAVDIHELNNPMPGKTDLPHWTKDIGPRFDGFELEPASKGAPPAATLDEFVAAVKSWESERMADSDYFAELEDAGEPLERGS